MGKPCFICGSIKTRFYVRPFRGGEVHVCQICRNAFTVPSPQMKYDTHPFFTSARNDEELFRSYARPIISWIHTHKKKGKLLDVGTGGGYLIEEAINVGYKAEGIEPSIDAVKFCHSRGLRVKHGYLTKKSYVKNSFDIVVLSHVLEHVPYPLSFLSVVNDILKPGGIVCLSQTNYEGIVPKLLGGFWEAWLPSEHFVHFSPFGIEYLLHVAGFIDIDIKVLPLGYKPQWKWGDFSTIANNIYNSVNYAINAFPLSKYVGGDQMYIIASKQKK